MKSLNLNITDAAKAHFKKLMNGMDDRLIRIGFKQIGCSGWQYCIEVGCVQPDDVCWSDGELIVSVPQAFSSQLNDSSIDYCEKELGQKKLVIDCPMTEMHCGCGESFSFVTEQKGETSDGSR